MSDCFNIFLALMRKVFLPQDPFDAQLKAKLIFRMMTKSNCFAHQLDIKHILLFGVVRFCARWGGSRGIF